MNLRVVSIALKCIVTILVVSCANRPGQNSGEGPRGPAPTTPDQQQLQKPQPSARRTTDYLPARTLMTPQINSLSVQSGTPPNTKDSKLTGARDGQNRPYKELAPTTGAVTEPVSQLNAWSAACDPVASKTFTESIRSGAVRFDSESKKLQVLLGLQGATAVRMEQFKMDEVSLDADGIARTTTDKKDLGKFEVIVQCQPTSTCDTATVQVLQMMTANSTTACATFVRRYFPLRPQMITVETLKSLSNKRDGSIISDLEIWKTKPAESGIKGMALETFTVKNGVSLVSVAVQQMTSGLPRTMGVTGPLVATNSPVDMALTTPPDTPHIEADIKLLESKGSKLQLQIHEESAVANLKISTSTEVANVRPPREVPLLENQMPYAEFEVVEPPKALPAHEAQKALPPPKNAVVVTPQSSTQAVAVEMPKQQKGYVDAEFYEVKPEADKSVKQLENPSENLVKEGTKAAIRSGLALGLRALAGPQGAVLEPLAELAKYTFSASELADATPHGNFVRAIHEIQKYPQDEDLIKQYNAIRNLGAKVNSAQNSLTSQEWELLQITESRVACYSAIAERKKLIHMARDNRGFLRSTVDYLFGPDKVCDPNNDKVCWTYDQPTPDSVCALK